jgi:hypothetical protein
MSSALMERRAGAKVCVTGNTTAARRLNGNKPGKLRKRNMDTTLRKRAAHLTLKLSLGALAILLLDAPSARAQECCPDADQFNQAKPAKVNVAARKSGHAKPVLVSKLARPNLGQAAASGIQPSRKQKPNRPARMVIVRQPGKSPENKE